ncbi:MAG: hypothetical protein LBG91_01615 [Treponema sp.]|jgi:hypothetical protein|nr:hypothetical protein [Treponema sp.]
MILRRKLKFCNYPVIFFFAIFTFSCAGQDKTIPPPVPEYKDEPVPFVIGEIIETQDGPENEYLPVWLDIFFNGGIAEIEKLSFYRNRYLFIAENENANFIALGKWAENFTVIQDFSALAAARIEKRMIAAASLYPDDEYGAFYETLVKKAFSAEYPGATKEETYWIKILVSQEYGNAGADGTNAPQEVYKLFVFTSIDKTIMQNVVNRMIVETIAAVTPTRTQSAAIKSLQQFFFEGF